MGRELEMPVTRHSGGWAVFFGDGLRPKETEALSSATVESEYSFRPAIVISKQRINEGLVT